MPLLTTTPIRIKKPIKVFALSKLFPVIRRASSEPIAANGMEKRHEGGGDGFKHHGQDHEDEQEGGEDQEFKILELILFMDYFDGYPAGRL